MRCAGRPRRVLGTRPGVDAEHAARCRGAALPPVVQRRGVRPEEPRTRAAGERSGLPAREGDAPAIRRARRHPHRWARRQGAQPYFGSQSQQPHGKGALGLSHVPRPQGRESEGRAVGERCADARARALGREAAGARTEGLGAAPRGLRRGIARPRGGRPDERGAARSALDGQGGSGRCDRGAEPAAR